MDHATTQEYLGVMIWLPSANSETTWSMIGSSKALTTSSVITVLVAPVSITAGSVMARSPLRKVNSSTISTSCLFGNAHSPDETTPKGSLDLIRWQGRGKRATPGVRCVCPFYALFGGLNLAKGTIPGGYRIRN